MKPQITAEIPGGVEVDPASIPPQPATEMPFDEIKDDKTARKRLDENLQFLKAMPPSRERALAITKLQEAIMWLGMDLKRIGNPNPYPHSYDPDSPIVSPTADSLKL